MRLLLYPCWVLLLLLVLCSSIMTEGGGSRSSTFSTADDDSIVRHNNNNNDNRVRLQRQSAVLVQQQEQQRNLQSTAGAAVVAVAQPMRIRFDTRLLEGRIIGDSSEQTAAEIRSIVNDILPAVAARWSQHLSPVVPVLSNNITVNAFACDLAQLTEAVSYSDADLVIVVGGDDDGVCQEKQLAFSRPCVLDEQTDRPIIGVMQFCLNQGNQTRQPIINGIELAPYYSTLVGARFREEHLQLPLLDIATHEMAHILAFAPFLFSYFRDENGQPLMERDVNGEPIPISRTCGDGTTNIGSYPSDQIVQVVQTDDGSWQQFLVTPTVQAMARNHFNCRTLLGGRLDDIRAGNNNCLGSHWHARNHFGDLLGAVASDSSERSLSLLTLALMQDSGWYRVNYNGAAQPAFGIGAGCDFVDRPCIDITTNQVSGSAKDEFCNDKLARLKGRTGKPELLSANIFCDPAHLSWTVCDLVQDEGETSGNFKTNFFDPTLRPFVFNGADNCPIPDIGLGLDCRIDASYSTFYPGERVGASSRCLNAFSADVSSGTATFRPACMVITCDAQTGVVKVGQGEFEQNCTQDGQQLPVPGRPSAFFVCPRLAAVCPELFVCPNGCSGRGECVYTDGSRPTCRCFDTTNKDQYCALPPIPEATPPVSAPAASRPPTANAILETPAPTLLPNETPLAPSPTKRPAIGGARFTMAPVVVPDNADARPATLSPTSAADDSPSLSVVNWPNSQSAASIKEDVVTSGAGATWPDGRTTWIAVFATSLLFV